MRAVLNVRVIIGLAVILVGVLLLLERLGYPVAVDNIWGYWPVILILVGLSWLGAAFSASQLREGEVFFPWGQVIMGGVLLLAGMLFLGRNLELVEPGLLTQIWAVAVPALIILVGISLLRGKAPGGLAGGRMAILGGIEEGKTAWKLESGSYAAFLGGVDLDLTTAEIPPGETVLDLTAMLGGIDVKIPAGLPVVVEGNALFGGVEFLGREDGGIIASGRVEKNLDSGDDRLLRIQARAVFGGIEIRD